MRSLSFVSDDATVVLGTQFAQLHRMAAKSLADRVAALEAIVGNKTIQEQFREQAELIDRRFTDEFRQQAELIDKLFGYRFEELDKKWGPRLANLERDMVIVREGISILLKRRPR